MRQPTVFEVPTFKRNKGKRLIGTPKKIFRLLSCIDVNQRKNALPHALPPIGANLPRERTNNQEKLKNTKKTKKSRIKLWLLEDVLGSRDIIQRCKRTASLATTKIERIYVEERNENTRGRRRDNHPISGHATNRARLPT